MNDNMLLSPDFKLAEFLVSATARKYGIANVPPPEAVDCLRHLCCYTLQPLRDALGLPIVISSGYRCRTLNERVTHHSGTSQHMSGQAADFHVAGRNTGLSRRELLIKAFRQIITDDSIDYDQLIIYPSFIHVSYVSRTANRHKLTRAYGNGKYCSLTRGEALSIH